MGLFVFYPGNSIISFLLFMVHVSVVFMIENFNVNEGKTQDVIYAKFKGEMEN